MGNQNGFSQQATPIPALWTVGIVVALPEELTCLTPRKLAKGECIALSQQILVAYAGAGPENATQAADLLISRGANRLISWGCAAGLSADLKPGDLILAKQILTEQKVVLNTDHKWLAHAKTVLSSKLPVITENILESGSLVAKSEIKKHMHSESKAVALDMESAAVLKSAHRANLPGLVIRAIADPVNMDLPQAVAQALNTEGQIKLLKLLRYLCVHPLEIPALIKLGLHFNAAQKTLKAVAKQLNEIVFYDSAAL